MNGWIDDSDLPQLLSIQLGDNALDGDSHYDRATINNGRYYYKNKLVMRSGIVHNDEWIDLPSLTELKGNKGNFSCIGSVILKSCYFGY